MPFLPARLLDHPQIDLLKKLAARHQQRVFLVGGFLRDQHLGRVSPVKDLDFAVSKDAIALARRFAKAIKGAFVLLDKESGCARVAKKTVDGICTYDFADFRAKSLPADLRARDFTVNTLTLNIAAIDPELSLIAQAVDHGAARRDIKAGMIRMVGVKAFEEDPLRILRAYSLAAQLGFKIESKTLSCMKKHKALIRKVSPERVREELFKILASPRAAVMVKAMDRHGILVELMPQVRVMYGLKQGGYHHLDVWKHSLETLVQVERLIKELSHDKDLQAYLNEALGGGHSRVAVLKLACILHDIGKPDTLKKEPGGRTSFHTHEHVGARVARIMALRLMLSTKERYALEDMVMLHLRPGYLSNFKRPSDKAVFRYLRDAKDEGASIVLLSMADQRATRGPLTTEHDISHHQDIGFGLIRKFFGRKKEKPLVRLLTGYDLIKELGLDPGPAFALILRKVEEAQHLGRVTTREQALALAKKAVI